MKGGAGGAGVLSGEKPLSFPQRLLWAPLITFSSDCFLLVKSSCLEQGVCKNT